MTLLKTINLEFDRIEVHYNKSLKNKPYLVRFVNYNNGERQELRLTEEDVKNLYNILKEHQLL
jgi:hypothetical protein